MNPQQSYPSLRSQGKLPAKVNPNAAPPTNALPSLPLSGELSSGEDIEVSEERTPHRVSESPNEPQNQAGRDSQAMVEGQARQEVPKQFQSPYHASISDYLAFGSSPSSAISSGTNPNPNPNPSYMQGGQLPLFGAMGDVHVSRGADNPFAYNDPVEATLNECAAAEEAKMRGQKKLLQLDTEIERMERNLRAEKKRREKEASD